MELTPCDIRHTWGSVPLLGETSGKSGSGGQGGPARSLGVTPDELPTSHRHVQTQRMHPHPPHRDRTRWVA